MSASAEDDGLALLSSAACSEEIGVHRVLLSVIFLPFAFVVFPFLTFHIALSLLNINLSDDVRRFRHIADQNFAVLSNGQEIAVAAIMLLVIMGVSAARYRRDRRQFDGGATGDRRFRELRGDRGPALSLRVEALWKKVERRSTPAPAVFWFPNSSVLAQAMVRSGRREIAVSSGLWERIEEENGIADMVLLHELAHLACDDPTTFRQLAALLGSATHCIVWLFRVLAVSTGLLLVQILITSWLDHPQTGFVLRQGIVVTAIGALAMSLCPITAAVIRRYTGLIVALTELRADVWAARWAGGLRRFVDVLSRNPMVHRSTLTDRARSLFSLDLTHLSETERLDLLRRPERLLTPKARYFGFSLLLVLLLPLNGLTPLFEGGIFDEAAVATVAAALMVATVAMLVLAGRAAVRISAARLLGLSVCATLFTAACQVNLYTFTYSLSTAAVEVGLGKPSLAENGSALSLANFLNVMSYPFGDIGQQLSSIWSRGWLIAGFLVTMVAFAGLLEVARSARNYGPERTLLPAFASLAGSLGVLMEACDPYRCSVIEGTPFGRPAAAWAGITHRLPGARFTLGPCLALLAILVPALIVVATKRKHAALSGSRLAG